MNNSREAASWTATTCCSLVRFATAAATSLPLRSRRSGLAGLHLPDWLGSMNCDQPEPDVGVTGARLEVVAVRRGTEAGNIAPATAPDDSGLGLVRTARIDHGRSRVACGLVDDGDRGWWDECWNACYGRLAVMASISCSSTLASSYSRFQSPTTANFCGPRKVVGVRPRISHLSSSSCWPRP